MTDQVLSNAVHLPTHEGVTIQEAAQALRISAKTVRRRLTTGELRGLARPRDRVSLMTHHDDRQVV